MGFGLYLHQSTFQPQPIIEFPFYYGAFGSLCLLDLYSFLSVHYMKGCCRQDFNVNMRKAIIIVGAGHIFFSMVQWLRLCYKYTTAREAIQLIMH